MTNTTGRTKEQTEHQTAKVNRWTAVLGAFTALLAVATAVLGFFTHDQVQQKEQAQTQAASASSTSADVSKQLAAVSSASASVAAERDQLKSDNDSLKNQLADAGVTTSATSDVLPVPAVWRQGTLSFDQGTGGTDFDALPSDRQWGRTTTSPSRGEFGGTTSDGQFVGDWAAKYVLIDAPATYSGCANATDYQSSVAFVLARLKVNQGICVKTDQGRTALGKIKKLGATSVTMDITVWDDAPK